MPWLAELEDKPENKAWLGAMIDAEGWIGIITYHHRLHAGKVYYHGVQFPEVDFTTTTRGIVEKVSRLTETPYHVTPPRLVNFLYTEPVLLIHVRLW